MTSTDIPGIGPERAAWTRLDNVPSVGMNYLYIWYRAVIMQHDRVLDQTSGRATRQVDAYQFIHALRQVHRSACMIRDALDGEAQEDARRAIAAFEEAVPNAKNARDILDHFDAYAHGLGNLSHPGVPPGKRIASEEAAREFDVFYEYGGPDSYTIHLGPLSIEVRTARTAADTLVDRMLDVLGLAASPDDNVVMEIDPANPVHVSWAYLMAIQWPPSDERDALLGHLVTPESRTAWGDFTEVARLTEGYATTSIPKYPQPDLAYVTLVPDTGKLRRATREVRIVDTWWLTLQRRSDLNNEWRVHAIGRSPVAAEELRWP